MEFPGEQDYKFCEVQAGPGVGASARGARYLSARYLILALVGFDELSYFGTDSNRFESTTGRSFKNRKQDEPARQRNKDREVSASMSENPPQAPLVMFIFGRNFFVRAE
jgi:hypothetical protein